MKRFTRAVQWIDMNNDIGKKIQLLQNRKRPFNRPFAAPGAGNFRIDHPVLVLMIGFAMGFMVWRSFHFMICL